VIAADIIARGAEKLRAAGCDNAWLEARWLAEDARSETEYKSFLARRAGGEPLHRILGWREFWGLRFALSPETLEPRPDSETVIETLITLRPEKNIHYRVLDLGTGTGCLLLAALHEYSQGIGVGIDAATGAVAAAQKNAAYLNLAARAQFQRLDWGDTAALQALGTFDVIVCNPPYIPSRDIAALAQDVQRYDPRAALDGGADGLAPYRLLAPQLRRLLAPGGIALFEIGHDQAAAIKAIFQSENLRAGGPWQDLGGKDRVITAQRE